MCSLEQRARDDAEPPLPVPENREGLPFRVEFFLASREVKAERRPFPTGQILKNRSSKETPNADFCAPLTEHSDGCPVHPFRTPADGTRSPSSGVRDLDLCRGLPVARVAAAAARRGDLASRPARGAFDPRSSGTRRPPRRPCALRRWPKRRGSGRAPDRRPRKRRRRSCGRSSF
jgi:hypothetical protein